MTGNEYINVLSTVTIENIKFANISTLYNCKLPDIIYKIISYTDNCIFLDNGYRVLSYNEIVNATADLHVDFVNRCILPVIDCCDNDYLVFHTDTNQWSLFNIIDECAFKYRDTFEEYIS